MTRYRVVTTKPHLKRGPWQPTPTSSPEETIKYLRRNGYKVEPWGKTKKRFFVKEKGKKGYLIEFERVVLEIVEAGDEKLRL